MLTVHVFGLKLVKEQKLPFKPALVNTSEASAKLLSSFLRNKDREHLAVLGADVKMHPVGLHIISIETLNATIVSPREVFKFALLSNAAGIIFGHNHPSGDPSPLGMVEG